ncbi:hypothetical protein LZ30DRAFT_251582 [Colletotrichum cereale]|nr:hypothetical protein LZ30DRAFT_251582 [Colletotrichum cereale]
MNEDLGQHKSKGPVRLTARIEIRLQFIGGYVCSMISSYCHSTQAFPLQHALLLLLMGYKGEQPSAYESSHAAVSRVIISECGGSMTRSCRAEVPRLAWIRLHRLSPTRTGIWLIKAHAILLGAGFLVLVIFISWLECRNRCVFHLTSNSTPLFCHSAAIITCTKHYLLTGRSGARSRRPRFKSRGLTLSLFISCSCSYCILKPNMLIACWSSS